MPPFSPAVLILPPPALEGLLTPELKARFGTKSAVWTPGETSQLQHQPAGGTAPIGEPAAVPSKPRFSTAADRRIFWVGKDQNHQVSPRAESHHSATSLTATAMTPWPHSYFPAELSQKKCWPRAMSKDAVSALWD